MPIWFRKTLAAFSILMFFSSGITLSLLFFPLIALVTFSRERQRSFSTWALATSYPLFLGWLKFWHLIDYERIPLPPDLPKDRAFVVVASHPTLLDVIFCMGWFRLLTVVKASWYRSWTLRFVTRMTHYIPAAGLPEDDGDFEPSLERMVAQLKLGRSLITFPEGTREPHGKLLRFHRGPFEVATRARVPVVPLFIATDKPFLLRGSMLPTERMTYTFEWLPFIDCAAEDLEPAKLRSRVHRMFEERRARYTEELKSAAPVLTEGQTPSPGR
ncbi:MAG: 1-acyl-sn-glycerol-3-phosphate acyltransferase [Deltaproteobacteria bacterium]|nr:1-acyl-sn-glycerol-3-phosphate acyltransferase [Deltaproteobacteria bacterium]